MFLTSKSSARSVKHLLQPQNKLDLNDCLTQITELFSFMFHHMQTHQCCQHINLVIWLLSDIVNYISLVICWPCKLQSFCCVMFFCSPCTSTIYVQIYFCFQTLVLYVLPWKYTHCVQHLFVSVCRILLWLPYMPSSMISSVIFMSQKSCITIQYLNLCLSFKIASQMQQWFRS